MTILDEAAGVIADNVEAFVQSVGTWQEMGALVAKDLAAGGFLPREITTVAELDALPNDVVIRDSGGDIYEMAGRDWYMPGLECSYPTWSIQLPALLIWNPEVKA